MFHYLAFSLFSLQVTGVVGRAEIISALLFFLSLLSYMRHHYLKFVVFTVGALLSKEQGITVLAVCLIYEFGLFIQKRSLIKFLIQSALLVLFTLCLLALRIVIMGGKDSLPVFTKFDNPAAFSPSPTRQLTFNYLLPLNALLLIFPQNLCCDWTMKSISLISSVNDPRNIGTVIFYLFLLSLLWQAWKTLGRGSNSLLVILSMIICPFLPATNLFFTVGFVIAERALYIPSAGFFLLVAIGHESICQKYQVKFRRTMNIIFCVAVCFFALKTQSRNADWQNELILFTSGISVNPQNAKLYNNIGHYYEKQKNFTAAIEYFNKASQHQSDDLGSLINIARTLINIGRSDEAEKLLWKLKPKVKTSVINKRIIPSYLNLWINLGNIISKNESRLNEAELVRNSLTSASRQIFSYLD